MKAVFKGILTTVIDLVQGFMLAAAAGAQFKGVLSMFMTFATDLPALLAGTVALQALRALVATKFEYGGEINRPTMALMGEAGTEWVAPQRSFKDLISGKIMPYVMDQTLAMARNAGMQPALAGGGDPALLREIKAMRSDMRRSTPNINIGNVVGERQIVERNLTNAEMTRRRIRL